MKHIHELALSGLADLLARRAWNAGKDQEHDQVPAADHLKGEGQGGEVGHGSGSREAAAEADQHQDDAESGHMSVDAAEAGERNRSASREDEEAECAGHGSGGLSYAEFKVKERTTAGVRPVAVLDSSPFAVSAPFLDVDLAVRGSLYGHTVVWVWSTVRIAVLPLPNLGIALRDTHLAELRNSARTRLL